MNNDWNIDWVHVDKLIKVYSNMKIAEMTGYHHSSIRNRRKKMGYAEINAIDCRWREIDPLIGTMSDYSLAQKLNMTQVSISYRRRKLVIPIFKKDELK